MRHSPRYRTCGERWGEDDQSFMKYLFTKRMGSHTEMALTTTTEKNTSTMSVNFTLTG